MSKLLHFGASYIIRYIELHPISWCMDKDLIRRGGYGDQAGLSPTTSISEFIELLNKTGDLFTQEEYWNHCQASWSEWLIGLNDDGYSTADQKRAGVRAKAFNNFYPSFIDTLHVWSMLFETGQFDLGLVDPALDSDGKVDMVLVKAGRRIHLALVGPTARADDDKDFKASHRNRGNGTEAIVVKLPFERPKRPGNKRWYCLKDFAVIVDPVQADMFAPIHR